MELVGMKSGNCKNLKTQVRKAYGCLCTLPMPTLAKLERAQARTGNDINKDRLD